MTTKLDVVKLSVMELRDLVHKCNVEIERRVYSVNRHRHYTWTDGDIKQLYSLIDEGKKIGYIKTRFPHLNYYVIRRELKSLGLWEKAIEKMHIQWSIDDEQQLIGLVNMRLTIPQIHTHMPQYTVS